MAIDPKDLIVIGAGGQLSTSLEERGATCWGLDVIDLTRPEAAEAKVAAAGARVVVNAAAHTAPQPARAPHTPVPPAVSFSTTHATATVAVAAKGRTHA